MASHSALIRSAASGARAVFSLLLVGFVVSSCDTDRGTCSTHPCDMLTIRPPPFLDGSWISLDAEAVVLFPSSTDPQIWDPKPGACLVGLASEGIETPARDDITWDLSLNVHCVSKDESADISFGTTVDAAMLSAAVDEPVTTTLEGSRDEIGGYGHASFRLHGTLTLEGSVGGFAPEPDFVSPDFRRRIRLDIFFASDDPARYDPAQRDPAEPLLQATLRFDLRAEDFIYTPEHTCRECAE